MKLLHGTNIQFYFPKGANESNGSMKETLNPFLPFRFLYGKMLKICFARYILKL